MVSQLIGTLINIIPAPMLIFGLYDFSAMGTEGEAIARPDSENGFYGMIVKVLRVIIILLPTLYAFTKFFELYNAWWAFVLAEGGSEIVGAFLLRNIYLQKIVPISKKKVFKIGIEKIV